MPDLNAAEQDIVAENDLVVVRLVVSATVKGTLLGVPADGKPVRWNAVDIYRVTDGKISEEWAADDVASIMIQVEPSARHGRPDPLVALPSATSGCRRHRYGTPAGGRVRRTVLARRGPI